MMRLPYLFLAVVFTCISSVRLHAQQVLFFENFDGCALPSDWQVKTKGNPNPVWYVGNTVQNDDNNGQSMNGSCFLFIDDDATGDNTAAYVVDFVSPPFDASKFSTVALSVDVHYRDWYEANESFTILVTDGTTETLISTFEGKRSNDSLFQFVNQKYDLSLVTQSPNARLIFRYDDAGDYNWWAGIDNILVVGVGTGTNVVTEAFNGCEKPANWETQIITGDHDWIFGMIDTSSKAYYEGTSMDGTCFAFFDDDALGEKAPFSNARIYTPWFDGTDFSKYLLNFDVILRYYKEKIAVIVQHENGQEFLVRESTGDVGGPQFPQYVHVELDLSPFRNQKMRVAFDFNDGNDWGWWAGIDNVKITGEGIANDRCSNALSITTGAGCIAGDNRTAVFDGPPAACTNRTEAGLWYTWKADFNGVAKFSSGADFNDVVNVFTGGCQTPQTAVCDNRDEHGFTGESTYFNVQSGTEYLIRVSGDLGGFGVSRGNLCAKIESTPSFPVLPLNDDCANATPLNVGAACISGTNRNAVMSPTLPSLNERARADVWYKFTAPALTPGEKLVLESGASFSDIITVYSGGCNTLQELAGNHLGHTLELPALTAGTTYLVQIAGNFATIEGSLCPELKKQTNEIPVNDQCVGAVDVPIGGQCVAGSNGNAGFSGNIPPCVATIDRDIWFKFVAPATGNIRVNTGADFEHTMAIWSGATCNDLTPVFCVKNPLRCEGYTFVGNLAPGATYYMQIAGWSPTSGAGTGDVCVKILDGAAAPDFQPLTLTVKEVCNGIGTAKLLVNTTGGVAPLSFQGSQNGQTLVSGTVYITIATDAMGCEKSYLGVVKECLENSCTLAASLTSLSPKCHDAADGSLTTNVAGGAGPYQYKWSNGSTAAIATGLIAGTYTVTVTDSQGCEFSNSATLANPLAIVAAATSLQNPDQGQSNGSILVDVNGGDGLYTFAWLLESVPFTNTEDLINAPAGNYELRITDGSGCTASFKYVLTGISGTRDLSGTFFAEVFPNPARDKATLSVALETAQTLYLSLNDATGRALQAWTADHVTEQNLPLDLQTLPAGTYQLRVLCGNGEMVVKSVVVGR